MKIEKLSDVQIDKQLGKLTASQTFTIEGPIDSATSISGLSKKLLAADMVCPLLTYYGLIFVLIKPQWIGGNLVIVSDASYATNGSRHKCLKIVQRKHNACLTCFTSTMFK